MRLSTLVVIRSWNISGYFASANASVNVILILADYCGARSGLPQLYVVCMCKV